LLPVGFTEQINHESRVRMLSTGDKELRRQGFQKTFLPTSSTPVFTHHQIAAAM
jgi:hypothetical protein